MGYKQWLTLACALDRFTFKQVNISMLLKPGFTGMSVSKMLHQVFFLPLLFTCSAIIMGGGAICLTVCTSVLPTCLAAGGSRVGIIANEYLAKRLNLLRTYTTYCTHIHIKYSCFKNSEVNGYCKYQFSSLIEPWCSEKHDIFTA